VTVNTKSLRGLLCLRRLGVAAAAVFLLSALPLPGGLSLSAAKDESSYKEGEIKAAFVYNFAKFVEWPADSFRDNRSSLSICVLGKHPFGNALDNLGQKTVGNRKIDVRFVQDPSDIEKCHILFISSSEKNSLSQILKQVKNDRTLTVSDMKGFSEAGGIITLVSAGEKMTFEVNLAVANQTSLKISSKLLQLGKVVR
jgi:hypothetical protein